MSQIQSPIIKTPTRTLSPWEIQRLRHRLRRLACSETWVDDQIITTIEINADGDPVVRTHYDSKIFPPGGRHETKMKWCRACGRYTPRPAIHLIEHRHERFGSVLSATLQCDDCRISDDEETHRELYQAGLHLRPAGSQSFISRRALHNERKRSVR